MEPNREWTQEPCPQPEEPAAATEGALPNRNWKKLLPLLLVAAVILACIVLTVFMVFGRTLFFSKLDNVSVDGTVPTVVGVAETTPTIPENPGKDTEKPMLQIEQLPEKPEEEIAADGAETRSAADAADPETSATTAGKQSYQEIYENAINSVVYIEATGSSGTSAGTGVIMSEDGYIITNCHVVESMQSYSVLLTDETLYEAALIGADEQTDLAVLKIDAEGLDAAEFGDSDALRVGDTVVAIGNPLGKMLRGTMTDGIVSAINRNVEIDGREMTLIQTNAALNSGNSGGPLLNEYGQVIGINTVKFRSYYSTSVEGIAFAIPIATAKPIVDELISKGFISGRPNLGLTVSELPEYVRIWYGLPSGVSITAVEETSDAYEKGIREGDILVAINDTRVLSTDEFTEIQTDCTIEGTATLIIYRNGSYYQVDVLVGENGTATA